jgi:uncharacterized protein (DUF885 family)
MWTIKDITEHFGLTEKQVRTRLAVLDPILDGHCRTGKQNAILLDDDGFKLFERLIQIEQQGITTKDAVKQMAIELGRHDGVERNHQGQALVDNGQTDGGRWAQLAIETLQERINSLEKDKAYLQRQVEQLLEQLRDKDTQLRALMPPPSAQRRQWWAFWRR